MYAGVAHPILSKHITRYGLGWYTPVQDREPQPENCAILDLFDHQGDFK